MSWCHSSQGKRDADFSSPNDECNQYVQKDSVSLTNSVCYLLCNDAKEKSKKLSSINHYRRQAVKAERENNFCANLKINLYSL